MKELVDKINEILSVAVILFFLLWGTGDKLTCFAAEPSASQIQRSQEVIAEEEALRQEIAKESKVFIKKVFVNGATLLTRHEVKDITLLFEKRWLAKSDIQQIIDLLSAAYKEKGYNEQAIKISYKIEKGCLRIFVEER